MKDEIVKSIQAMSGKYSPYQVFSDWITMSAISIQNNCTIVRNEIWNKREKQYIDVANKYDKEEIEVFSKMFQMLLEAMEMEIRDWLGEIFMESECGNKNTGQFFTPWHISILTAESALPEKIEGKIKLNEPSSGGGGTILAAAAVLKKRGINYQNVLNVAAQDLDWLAVYMTYVQLSITGISACVLQGDTLKGLKLKDFREEFIFKTPKKMGAII